MRQLVLTTVTKLIIVPVLVLGTAILLGFRGIDLGSLLAVFASPTAIGAYALVVQMDSDADLTFFAVIPVHKA